MTTNSGLMNLAVFLVLVAAFFWLVVEFADKPLLVGVAGLALVGYLLLVWLPVFRSKVKKSQKPDGLGNSDFFG